MESLLAAQLEKLNVPTVRELDKICRELQRVRIGDVPQEEKAEDEHLTEKSEERLTEEERSLSREDSTDTEKNIQEYPEEEIVDMIYRIKTFSGNSGENPKDFIEDVEHVIRKEY